MLRIVAVWGVGIGSLLLLLELLLRLLPVSTATLGQTDAQTGRRHYPAGHAWVQSTGWDLRNPQRLRAGASGYAGEHDPVGAAADAVLLVGDSFVEASMLPLRKRLAAQLEAAACRPVVALGTPGSSLLDYAERLDWALRQGQARDAVLLLERGDVKQAICQAGQFELRCLDRSSGTLRQPEPRTQPPGLLKRWLRHSALAQYLFAQLKLEPSSLWASLRRQAQAAQGHAVGQAAAPAAAAAAPADALLERVEDAFVARVRELPLRKLVVVVDADRPALLRGESGSSAERERLIAKLRAAGWAVVDAAPLFREHLRRSPLRLEVGPYDAHLNPLGLGLLAKAAAPALRGAPDRALLP